MSCDADMVTFGLGMPAYPARGSNSSDYYRAIVVEAARAGFERLWVGDHALWHNPRLELFSHLGALAAWSDLPLGASVALAPLRHPVWLAKSAATIDALTSGRFILGVGVGGEYEPEFSLLGVAQGRRGRLTDEAIDTCRRAWSGDLHPGFSPVPPGGDIPIWVGGRSPAAVARAGRLGDGYIGLFQTPRRYREMLASVRSGREERLGSPRGLAAAIVLWAACGADGAGVRAAAGNLVAHEYRVAAEHLEKHIVAGTPAEVVIRLREYVSAGAEHIQIQIADHDMTSQIRLFGEKVLPAFR